MSRYIAQGSKVEDFEAAMRTFFGNPHVLTVNVSRAGGGTGVTPPKLWRPHRKFSLRARNARESATHFILSRLRSVGGVIKQSL